MAFVSGLPRFATRTGRWGNYWCFLNLSLEVTGSRELPGYSWPVSSGMRAFRRRNAAFPPRGPAALPQGGGGGRAQRPAAGGRRRGPAAPSAGAAGSELRGPGFPSRPGPSAHHLPAAWLGASRPAGGSSAAVGPPRSCGPVVPASLSRSLPESFVSQRDPLLPSL